MKRLTLAVVLGTLLITITASRGQAQESLYLNPDLPVDQRVDDLISHLKLYEKAEMLCTTAPAIERLRIPVFNGWNQCLRGIQWSEPTTVFPCPIAMAATWDTSLVQSVASAISDEGRAIYNSQGRAMYYPNVRKNGLVYRSPVLNISRDPRWGRIAEVWGEDPVLTGRMGVAFVKGLQGDDPHYLKLAATIKHYAVNNQETGRVGLNAVVPVRILMEYWLPHFRAAVEEGHAQSIMASLNAVNGVPCSANSFLLTTLLRDQWKFDGFAVPDSGGVRTLQINQGYAKSPEEAVALMIRAGIDVDDKYFPDLIPRAVEQGFLTEKEVDVALHRVLRVRFRLGEFDPANLNPYSRIPASVIDGPANRALALRTAQSGIVLLTNRDNLLPLDKSKLKKVAVIGPEADRITPGAVNYTGKWSTYVVPLEGIKNRLGPAVEVNYVKGCDFTTAPDRATSFAQAAAAAKDADVAIVCVGLNERMEGETQDRSDIFLPAVQEDLIQTVQQANPHTVVVFINGCPLSTHWARQNVSAMLDMFYDGEEGGNALADVLLGNVNPAGRLPYTIYDSLQQIPPQSEYDVSKGFTYMYQMGQSQFAFGHGLSYTQFDYANAKLSQETVSPDGEVKVSIDIKNTGPRAGDEVVQLYTHEVASPIKRPIKQLAGFQRISLSPGETQTATFVLSAPKLAYYDEAAKAFVVRPGAFEIMVGSSSDDIRATKTLTVSPAATASAAPTSQPASPAILPGNGLAQHPFFYAGEWNHPKPVQTMFVVRGGKVVWSYDIPTNDANKTLQEFSDATMLSNGNVVFARKTGAGEVTPEKKLIWNYDAPKGFEVHVVQPLGKDRVMFVQNGDPAKMVIVNITTGKTEKELVLPVGNPKVPHPQFRRVRITKANTILAAHMDNGKVVEYDMDGKPIWSVNVASPWDASRLDNGNTLISSNKSFVREVNPKGETVWEFAQKDVPDIRLFVIQEANRLANGNTVIANWCPNALKDPKLWPTSVQILEVTPEKKVVWALRAWTPPADLGPASCIQLLDEPGIPENGDQHR